MKPILIDAIYINYGGALTVLNRFIDGAVEANLNLVLLKDERCQKLHSEEKVKNIVILPPSLKSRHKYYKTHRNDFHSILCLGNVPPTINMSCKVHTYFHNLSVLSTPSTYSIKQKIKFYVKKRVIQYLSKNTDSWVVQTWNTENLIKETIGNKTKPFYIYPIYTIPESFKNIRTLSRTEYLFIGDYTYSKGHDVLLQAWERLHELGTDLVLNLTVSRQPSTEQFFPKMDRAIANHVPIINHGFIPFKEVCKLYGRSKVVIYPSQTESLGLGIVEGIHAGCDVITADLPYAHAICQPSEVFDCKDADSIVSAVLKYEEGHSPKSILTIHDCMTELINLLTK